MALVFLFLYAPIIILIVFSFNAGNSSSVWKGFSLKWYRAASLQPAHYEQRLYHAAGVAAGHDRGHPSPAPSPPSACTPCAAAVVAAGERRQQHPHDERGYRHRRQPVPAVRGVLQRLGRLRRVDEFSWQSLVVLPERLTMGFGTLLIAHICFNIPYVILSVGPKLRQMDRNLMDAAQDLGCTWMQAFWKVVIPEIKPGIVSGAADGLHHVRGRLHHQLLHRRHQLLHAGHDHLRHDQEAGQPGDQRHLHPAVRDGADAAGRHQPAGEPVPEPRA